MEKEIPEILNFIEGIKFIGKGTDDWSGEPTRIYAKKGEGSILYFVLDDEEDSVISAASIPNDVLKKIIEAGLENI